MHIRILFRQAFWRIGDLFGLTGALCLNACFQHKQALFFRNKYQASGSHDIKTLNFAFHNYWQPVLPSRLLILLLLQEKIIITQ